MNAKNNQVEHINPYREGDSKILFAYMQTKQTFTRSELVDFMQRELGKSKVAAKAKVQTLISPRKSSKRGDCRGQVSSQGHIYYILKLPRAVRYGYKEPQKLRLCWRAIELPRRYRREPVRVKEVKQEKQNVMARVKALSKQLARVQAELELIK